MDQLGLDSTILDRSKLDWTELDWAGRDWSALYNSGLDWTEPEFKRRELPLSCSVIDHKWCKNVIWTKKLNTRRNRVCHGCPYHILMSSVIYNWTNHNFKLRPRAARTDYFKFSFFNRFVDDWNSLTKFAMSASSWIPLELDCWIIFVRSFILLSRNEIYSDFTFCLLFSCCPVSSFLYNIQLFIWALESSFYAGIQFPPITFLYLLYFYMVIKI